VFARVIGQLIIGEDCANYNAAEGAKAIGLSHGDFGFVVQALDDAAGKQFLRAEIVQDQFAVIAQSRCKTGGVMFGSSEPRSTPSVNAL